MNFGNFIFEKWKYFIRITSDFKWRNTLYASSREIEHKKSLGGIVVRLSDIVKSGP